MEKMEQKTEAIKRMKSLELHENVVREFEKENKVNLSEHGGILQWLNDKQAEAVKKFEEEYNSLVYHVIHSYTTFGELLSMLYVSATSEEWEYDQEDLKEGYPIAYVKNLDDESCSEIGSIGVKSVIGGLVRTA